MELPGNNDGHRYQLYVKSRITSGTEDYPETIEPFKDRNFSENNWPYGYADIDPFESYRSVFNGDSSAYENPELIFSRVDNITVDNSSGGITSPDAIANMVLHQLPTLAGGWGVHGMTQKQCDAYYMNDGTDCPGKDKEIGRGDGSSRLTGYVTSMMWMPVVIIRGVQVCLCNMLTVSLVSMRQLVLMAVYGKSLDEVTKQGWELPSLMSKFGTIEGLQKDIMVVIVYLQVSASRNM